MNMRMYGEKGIIALLYGVLLIPLLFQHDLMHPLITLKVVFFQTVIAALAALYCGYALVYPAYRPRMTWVAWGIIVVLSSMLISSVFGVNGARSAWSIPERMTGMIFWGHLAAFFFILSILRSRLAWMRYLSFSVWVSFAVAAFPVIQLSFPGIFFDAITDRLGGTVGNPIFLSSYLLIHVFLAGECARLWRQKGLRWWFMYGIIGVFDLMVIILTQTRGAFIGLIAGAAALSWYAARGDAKNSVRYAVAAFWLLCVVLGFLFFLTRHNPIWQSIPVASRLAREGLRADARLLAWRSGLRGFMDRPALGWGWENFIFAFSAHYNPQLLRHGFNETFFDKPHNVFIQFLVEMGIIGLAAYMALFGVVLWRIRRRPWLVALIAAYLVQNFFAFDTVSSYIALFVVFAYSSAEDKEGEIKDGEKGTGSRVGGMGAGAMLLAAALIGAYFVNYRIWRGSHEEWMTINYFIQRYVPEGTEHFNAALAAQTPYHDYIIKDLAPNIPHLYEQNIPLLNAPIFIRRAVDEMKGAVSRNPLDYAFYIAFADMMPGIRMLDSSYLNMGEQALVQAERVSPRRQATQYILAKIKNLKGDKAGALAAMRQAIALDPEVGDAHFYYALLLFEGGGITEGIDELHRAAVLGRAPKNADEARIIASHIGDAGKYKESQVYYQQALLFKPDDLETKMKLGLVYYFDKQYAAARRMIAEVMKIQDLTKSPQYPALKLILRELGLEK